VLFFVVFIVSAFGVISPAKAGVDVIAQHQGYTDNGSGCKVSMIEEVIEDQDAILQVLIAGLQNAGNFTIKLNSNRLPLEANSTISVMDGGEIQYTDGVLFYREVRKTGLFSREIIEIEMEVDAYLENLAGLELRLFERGMPFFGDSQPVTNLSCMF